MQAYFFRHEIRPGACTAIVEARPTKPFVAVYGSGVGAPLLAARDYKTLARNPQPPWVESFLLLLGLVLALLFMDSVV